MNENAAVRFVLSAQIPVVPREVVKDQTSGGVSVQVEGAR